MIKIAAQTLDIYDDDASEIARKLPTELHTVKVASREEVAELPDRCFALVMKTASGVRRRFPVHTEDSLKLSEAYFNEVKGGLPAEARVVAEGKFAEVKAWFAAAEDERAKLSHAYNGVAYVDLTALQPQKKVAFADRAWGLTIDGRNHFPLHDEVLVKTAIDRFASTREGLAPDQAFLYARNIEKRASSLGLEVPANSPVNLYTNPDINTRALAVALDQRKHAAASIGVDTTILDQVAVLSGCDIDRGEIERDASYLSRQFKQASAQKIDAERVLSILNTFDKLAGFGRRDYLRGMADPFAACFKKADYPGGAVLVDGVDLSKIDRGALGERFDQDFVSEFDQNPATVYKSLPDPVKSVLRAMAEDAMGQPRRGLGRDAKPSSNVGSAGDPLHRLNPTYSNGNVLVD